MPPPQFYSMKNQGEKKQNYHGLHGKIVSPPFVHLNPFRKHFIAGLSISRCENITYLSVPEKADQHKYMNTK